MWGSLVEIMILFLYMADALVAATALSLNAKLATRNKKDFEGIKGLKFFKLLN